MELPTRVLIVYYSRSGNTRKMADCVAEGVTEAGGEPEVCAVDDVSLEAVDAADAIAVGSPTHYGHPASQIRTFFDRSVRLHGKLEGKIGAAFTSSHNIGGGNETTVLHILESMLVHGMIIQGTSEGDHYGPVAIGSPDRRAVTQCKLLGKRMVSLSRRLRHEGSENS